MKLIFALLILLFLTFILCEEDYYKLLGVARNCDEAVLKKAFKKLSLKYHPDKNKKNPEKAKEHYAKIVNAYEVLKDPDTRNAYDKRGVKGVQDFQAGRNSNQQDPFGGGGFNFRFENFDFEDHFRQHHQPKQKPLFENSDVFDIRMDSISSFFRRNEVWLILFYKSGEKSSQEKKELWENLAGKYYGIFKVAGVDCQQEEELCEEEFQNYVSPSVLLFPANSEKEPVKYTKNWTEKDLANFAVGFMESFVEYVSQTNYKDFIKRDLFKVLLFTDKKSTPPLYKVLSKDFKDKLIFGEVRNAQDPLFKQFNIQKMPTMLILTDPQNFEAVAYDGAYKKDQIVKFLRDFSHKKQETRVQVIFDIQQACQNQNLCLVLGSSSMEKLQWLEQLQTKHQKIQFYVLENRLNFCVMVKGKRRKYAFQWGVSEQQVEEMLADVLGGGREFRNIEDDWPVQLRINQLGEELPEGAEL